MTDLKDTLAALSEAATQGEWAHYFEPGNNSSGEIQVGDQFILIVAGGNYALWRDADDGGEAEFKANGDLACTLVNAYRSGQLVPVPSVESFQSGVDAWMDACFGATIKSDRLERCDRFIEEALELCQTEPTFTADRAHALVDYVFGRPVGEPQQEVGGVMVTLAALCNTAAIDMNGAGATELARVWTKVEAIRAKQAAKPTGSALPIAAMKGEGRGDG